MTRRTVIGLLLGASVVVATACLFIGRTVIRKTARCDEVIEQSAGSPDGELVATSTMKACPVGPLSTTNYSVSVALSFHSRGSSATNQSLVFESADAAEAPTLTWVNGGELLLTLQDMGEVRASKHELGGVRIRYAAPAWIWDRLGKIEAGRLHSERESQDLYNQGKLSKEEWRARRESADAMASQASDFRKWLLANATVENSLH